MYFMKALACGEEWNIIATSPEPWRALAFVCVGSGCREGEEVVAGGFTGRWCRPCRRQPWSQPWRWARCEVISDTTKSASITIAALGIAPAFGKTWSAQLG